MKKLLALAGTAVLASSAFAQVLSVTAEPIDSLGIQNIGVYNSVPGPYSAFGPGSFAQNDDYQADLSATPFASQSYFNVQSMQFVGGVTTAGGTLDFFFTESDLTTVVSSFSLNFSVTGDFIWTITFGAATPLAAQNGGLQIQSRAGTSGRWFFTTSAPGIGTNNLAVGSGAQLNPQRYQAFSINAVPEPASMLVLGAGLAALAARRRRKG